MNTFIPITLYLLDLRLQGINHDLTFVMVFLIRTRRKDVPWEVVDSKAVDPVPMYYEDEGVSSVRRV